MEPKRIENLESADNLKLLSYGFSGKILPQRAYAKDIEGITLEKDEETSEGNEETGNDDFNFEEVEGPILTKAPKTATPLPTKLPADFQNNDTNNNLAVIIIVAAAIVVVSGVLATIIIIKKKKH